jgi:hypothetical protein
LNNDQYIRVARLDSMIKYYLQQPLGFSPHTEESQREALARVFDMRNPNREKLGVITATWRGEWPNVWVISKAELESVISALPKGSQADHVRDRLGLKWESGCAIVYVIYPHLFDEVRAFKPTSIDAHWNFDCYISSTSNDGWGKTFCLDGATGGFEERIHEIFQGLTDAFEPGILGTLMKDAEVDQQHLLAEAIRRV